MNLQDIGDRLDGALAAKNAAREKALPLCRRVVRLSANAIRAVHRGEDQEAQDLMEEGRAHLEEAVEALAAHEDVRYAGFVHDAAKEYAEARITYAVVFGHPLPDRDELRVEPAAYLNGMGEAIGEMRRHLLDLMRSGHLERSEEILQTMDEMFYLLTSMDYPDAITGGLRRTADVARSIIERTRGDLTTTIIQENLKGALERAVEEG